jgi:hypothetical protein
MAERSEARPSGAVKKFIPAKLRSFVFNTLREQNSAFFNFFTAPEGAGAVHREEKHLPAYARGSECRSLTRISVARSGEVQLKFYSD